MKNNIKYYVIHNLEKGRYENMNKLFKAPENYDLRIKEITNLNKNENPKFTTKIIISCRFK